VDLYSACRQYLDH